jgi:hypothetical protein
MNQVAQIPNAKPQCGYHDPFGGPCILPVGHKYPNGRRSGHEDQEGLDATAERERQQKERTKLHPTKAQGGACNHPFFCSSEPNMAKAWRKRTTEEEPR